MGCLTLSTTGSRQPKALVAYRIKREGGGTAGTTENVAILFTDIVGSTELSQRSRVA